MINRAKIVKKIVKSKSNTVLLITNWDVSLSVVKYGGMKVKSGCEKFVKP